MCVCMCPHLAEGARGSHQLAERKDGGGASVYTCIFYMRVYIDVIPSIFAYCPIYIYIYVNV